MAVPPCLPDLITAAAVATRIGVRPDTVRVWSRRGWIPSIRISANVVRFEWTAVLAALRNRGVAPRAGAVR